MAASGRQRMPPLPGKQRQKRTQRKLWPRMHRLSPLLGIQRAPGKLQQMGKTILLSSHILSELAEVFALELAEEAPPFAPLPKVLLTRMGVSYLTSEKPLFETDMLICVRLLIH